MGTNRAAVIFHPETYIYIRAMFQFITLQFLFIIVHVVSRGLMPITVRGVFAGGRCWPGDLSILKSSNNYWMECCDIIDSFIFLLVQL